MYFAGDGAKRDADGYYWLLGRVDDVMNVAGHRISTIEVESALVDHRSVAEAAVVGKNDPVLGSGDLRVRHPPGRPGAVRRAGAPVARARGPRHRPDRPPQVPAVHAGPAQDPLRQDHAPAPARHRRGPAARATRRPWPTPTSSTPSARTPARPRTDRALQLPAQEAPGRGSPPHRRRPDARGHRVGPQERRRRLRRPDRGVAARRRHAHRRAPVGRAQPARGDRHRRRVVGARRRLGAVHAGAGPQERGPVRPHRGAGRGGDPAAAVRGRAGRPQDPQGALRLRPGGAAVPDHRDGLHVRGHRARAAPRPGHGDVRAGGRRGLLPGRPADGRGRGRGGPGQPLLPAGHRAGRQAAGAPVAPPPRPTHGNRLAEE